MAERFPRKFRGSSLDRAVACIKEGGIVAFPTETCYGLAVDPECLSAVEALFKVKKRHSDKALLVLIERREQLLSLAECIPAEFQPLMDKYWPGPLTLVFPAQKRFHGLLTGNSGNIGVRISSHPVASELVRKMGKPITATSANISGQLPANTAEEVEKIFDGSLDYILDGGRTSGGLCSTVLGFNEGQCTLLRQGEIDVSADLRAGRRPCFEQNKQKI